jgi:hypothetical protein
VSVHGKDVGKFLQLFFRKKRFQFFEKYTRAVEMNGWHWADEVIKN